MSKFVTLESQLTIVKRGNQCTLCILDEFLSPFFALIKLFLVAFFGGNKDLRVNMASKASNVTRVGAVFKRSSQEKKRGATFTSMFKGFI